MSGFEFGEHACAPEEGVVTLDLRDKHVVFSDGRMEAILGLKPGSITGARWLKLVDADQLAELGTLLETNDVAEGVFRYRHGAGRDWVPVRTRCLRQGEIMHLCVREATMTLAEEKLASAREQIRSWGPPPA